jgi:S-methylmethionine-dependent homocysteine/selenocysteine methylase
MLQSVRILDDAQKQEGRKEGRGLRLEQVLILATQLANSPHVLPAHHAAYRSTSCW